MQTKIHKPQYPNFTINQINKERSLCYFPKCQHTNFIKSEFNNGRQRYKCKGCVHCFLGKKPIHHKSNEVKEWQSRRILKF